VDPEGLVDGVNIYTYVGDNPVSFKDPSGTQIQTAFDELKKTFGLNSEEVRLRLKSGERFTPPAYPNDINTYSRMGPRGKMLIAEHVCPTAGATRFVKNWSRGGSPTIAGTRGLMSLKTPGDNRISKYASTLDEFIQKSRTNAIESTFEARSYGDPTDPLAVWEVHRLQAEKLRAQAAGEKVPQLREPPVNISAPPLNNRGVSPIRVKIIYDAKTEAELKKAATSVPEQQMATALEQATTSVSRWSKYASYVMKGADTVGKIFTIVGAHNEAAKSAQEANPGPLNLNAMATYYTTLALGVVVGVVDDAMAATGYGAPFVAESWEHHDAGPSQVLVGEAVREFNKWWDSL
jgi:hypothetical protein